MTFLRQRMEGGVELQKIFLDPNLNNKFMLFQIHIVHLSSHSQVAHPPIGFGSGFGAGFKTKFGDRSTPQPHIRSNDEVIAQTRKYGNGFKKEYSTSSPQPQPQPQPQSQPQSQVGPESGTGQSQSALPSSLQQPQLTPSIQSNRQYPLPQCKY